MRGLEEDRTAYPLVRWLRTLPASVEGFIAVIIAAVNLKMASLPLTIYARLLMLILGLSIGILLLTGCMLVILDYSYSAILATTERLKKKTKHEGEEQMKQSDFQAKQTLAEEQMKQSDFQAKQTLADELAVSEFHEALRNLQRSVTKEATELGGVKYDNGKPALSLVNRECLNGIARAMMYGANKYGRNNYKQGLEWTRVLDAMLRHATAYIAGEDNDPESGLNHIYHVGACVNMLLYYIENNVGRDDR